MIEAQILSLLYNHLNQPLSGQIIADQLGISRNAVWKTIEHLRLLGYKISTHHKKGYQLDDAIGTLHDSQLQALLHHQIPNIKINILDEATSTNDLAKQAISQNRTTQLFITQKQTQGRGRLGKHFYSDLDHGLYFSLAFKPNPKHQEFIPLYTLATAAALVQTLETYVNEAIGIKWVNDLFYQGKKIAGILSEASTNLENGEVAYIIIGVGINLAGNFQTAQADVQNVAGTLFGEQLPKDFNYNQFLADSLIRLYHYHLQLDQKTFLPFYNQRLLGRNQRVSFQEADQSMSTAIIRSINDSGHLIVEQNGKERALISQQISLSSHQFTQKRM
ncbi:biotin--[acetyl-CoA-carboxylase] ligase [Fundicoccus culcitae]|uniref:Biotin--[acetyl-CoA-carboxylase] ligase n=1 Tax=Fundicoccus culcitae TaxID=2969821 RepID=A0ABY5P2P3_9LACT|nr:biotin--[acetyl-CoA-carboxylase] ligase [Fundicoccus culcitae]UUX32992.1 biotin--[acetyl-CoA-carboxylase] ligase [Fundicoccus culcitae]